MLARDSRYWGLPDEVNEDLRGPARDVISKALRLLPDVDGEFQHTLVEGERLDHLATRYYRDPRRWWLICDANPDFVSPLDLVGAGPQRTLKVPLRRGAALGALAVTLRREPGVAGVRFADDPLSNRVAALVTYNRALMDEQSVFALLESVHDRSEPPQGVGRAGKRITVPPDGVR